MKSLDLSGNGYSSLKAGNLNWVYGLSFLKVLDLSGVDLSNAKDWLESINIYAKFSSRVTFILLYASQASSICA